MKKSSFLHRVMLSNSVFVFLMLQAATKIHGVSMDYAEPTKIIYQPIAMSGEHDFDILIFTQQWPETDCKVWKEKNPSHTCLLPKDRDSWTIHGIWPTKMGTLGPFFCNKTWHFDPEKIRPIESDMTEHWPNIENGTYTYSLWAHEWTKHGTCAAVLEPLNSELKYFSKGLDFLEMYSMTDILKEGGVTPSNNKKYAVGDINAIIKSKLDVNPVIECRKEKGQNWLLELRICFNKNLELMDCDGVVHLSNHKSINSNNVKQTILTNCDVASGILYPQDVDNDFIIQLFKLVSWLQWFTL